MGQPRKLHVLDPTDARYEQLVANVAYYGVGGGALAHPDWPQRATLARWFKRAHAGEAMYAVPLDRFVRDVRRARGDRD